MEQSTKKSSQQQNQRGTGEKWACCKKNGQQDKHLSQPLFLFFHPTLWFKPKDKQKHMGKTTFFFFPKTIVFFRVSQSHFRCLQEGKEGEIPSVRRGLAEFFWTWNENRFWELFKCQKRFLFKGSLDFHHSQSFVEYIFFKIHSHFWLDFKVI